MTKTWLGVDILVSTIIRKLRRAVKLVMDGNIRGVVFRIISHYFRYKVYQINKKREGLALEVVTLFVTQKCTLKCKGCSNLIQYYANPYHIEASQICRDLELLMKHVDYVGEFNVIGGEPLIYKEIPVILSEVQKYKERYGLLRIITNGTVKPSSEILQAIKLSGAIVRISDYGQTSGNIEFLRMSLRKNNIYFICEKPEKWTATQQLIDGTQRSESQVQSVYHECTMACYHIVNGRLYHCAFLANGDMLRVFPSNPLNFVDLLDESITKDDLRHYNSKDSAYPGCRYCTGHNHDLPPIPIAEQIRQSLPYRIYD